MSSYYLCDTCAHLKPSTDTGWDDFWQWQCAARGIRLATKRTMSDKWDPRKVFPNWKPREDA